MQTFAVNLILKGCDLKTYRILKFRLWLTITEANAMKIAVRNVEEFIIELDFTLKAETLPLIILER